jgi:uncharacterized membrane protein YheB (UPF0754 family)
MAGRPPIPLPPDLRSSPSPSQDPQDANLELFITAQIMKRTLAARNAALVAEKVAHGTTGKMAPGDKKQMKQMAADKNHLLNTGKELESFGIVQNGMRDQTDGVQQTISSHSTDVGARLGGLERLTKSRAEGAVVTAGFRTLADSTKKQTVDLQNTLSNHNSVVTAGFRTLADSTNKQTGDIQNTLSKHNSVVTAGFQAMADSTEKQTGDIQSTLSKHNSVITAGFQAMGESSKRHAQDIQTTLTAHGTALKTHGTVITAGIHELKSDFEAHRSVSETIISGKKSAIERENAKLLRMNDTMARELDALATQLHTLQEQHEAVVSREYKNAYTDLVSDYGASVRNRTELKGVNDQLSTVNISMNQLTSTVANIHTSVEKAAPTMATSKQGEDIKELIRNMQRSLSDDFAQKIRAATTSIESKLASTASQDTINKIIKSQEDMRKTAISQEGTDKIMAVLSGLPTQLEEKMDSRLASVASHEDTKSTIAALSGLVTSASFSQFEEKLHSGLASVASQDDMKSIITALSGLPTSEALSQFEEKTLAILPGLSTDMERLGDYMQSSMATVASQNDMQSIMAALSGVSTEESIRQLDGYIRSGVSTGESIRQLDDHIRSAMPTVASQEPLERITALQDEIHTLRTQAADKDLALRDRDVELQTLKRRIDELESEQPSRRRRIDPPPPPAPVLDPQIYGDLLRVKAWTGSQLLDFKDLSAEVRAALLGWSQSLSNGWSGRTAVRKLSCVSRQTTATACIVPSDDPNVACNACIGARTFCVRRRSKTDGTVTMFAIDHRDQQRQGGVNQVSFWRNIKGGRVRPSKDMYTTKL